MCNIDPAGDTLSFQQSDQQCVYTQRLPIRFNDRIYFDRMVSSVWSTTSSITCAASSCGGGTMSAKTVFTVGSAKAPPGGSHGISVHDFLPYHASREFAEMTPDWIVCRYWLL